MVRSEKMRLGLAIAVLAGLWCCHPRICFAQTITITEQQPLRFGVLQTPGGAADSFTVDPSGATSGTGTLLYGTVSQGIYRIRCTANCAGTWTLAVDVGNVSSGDPHLSITGFTGTYQSFSSFSLPRSGLPRPAGTGSLLSIGATATYNSSIPAGLLVPTFDIVITTQ